MSDDLSSPSALWLAITAMPRPSRVVDFPRTDITGKPVGEVRLRVLTQEEQMLSSAEAERFAKKAIKELPKSDEAKRGYDDLYNNAAAVEILFLACRQKDAIDRPFFPSPSALRKALTADEVGALMIHYYTAQSELGPIIARMSQEEMDAWVKRLGEGGSRFPLDLLSWEQLKELTFSLATRLHKLTTGTTSAGSPPNEDLSPPPPPDPSM